MLVVLKIFVFFDDHLYWPRIILSEYANGGFLVYTTDINTVARQLCNILALAR
jgi:hypothetical protein